MADDKIDSNTLATVIQNARISLQKSGELDNPKHELMRLSGTDEGAKSAFNTLKKGEITLEPVSPHDICSAVKLAFKRFDATTLNGHERAIIDEFYRNAFLIEQTSKSVDDLFNTMMQKLDINQFVDLHRAIEAYFEFAAVVSKNTKIEGGLANFNVVVMQQLNSSLFRDQESKLMTEVKDPLKIQKILSDINQRMVNTLEYYRKRMKIDQNLALQIALPARSMPTSQYGKYGAISRGSAEKIKENLKPCKEAGNEKREAPKPFKKN